MTGKEIQFTFDDLDIICLPPLVSCLYLLFAEF
jgi:hypothetical protein